MVLKNSDLILPNRNLSMNIWNVSMECAGIAEAGGVKNVTYALCKGFKNLGNEVTLFIPVFKCNNWEHIKDLQENVKTSHISTYKKDFVVSYSTATFDNPDFKIVFINNEIFSEKEDIYTYTTNEQKLNPENKKGTGHKDFLLKDVLFQKAVVQYGLMEDKENLPDIIHCQDASTAMIPAFINELEVYSKTKCVVTIHNAGPYYHHSFINAKEAKFYTDFDDNLINKSLNGEKVEPFLLAANSNAILTTVSEHYAQELIDPNNNEQTEGLSSIFYNNKYNITGITNGIDFSLYNPKDINISKLPYEFNTETLDLSGKYECRYYFIDKINNHFFFEDKQYGCLDNIDDNTIFFAYHGRITTQKGINLLCAVIPRLLSIYSNIKFIITGQGELTLETNIKKLTEDFKGRIVFFNGYNKKIARLTSACCDFIILPSCFEPCGLEDFIAQIYGTLPIAHKTGGLCKIVDNETGFLYIDNTLTSLQNRIENVIKLKRDNPKIIQKLIQNAASYIHKNYSWNNIIENKYLPFFEKIVEKKQN